MLKLRKEILGQSNEITRFEPMKIISERNRSNLDSFTRSFYCSAFCTTLLWMSFQRACIIFFFFFVFSSTRYQSRLRYLIWWRGKLFQDKLPIRSRLARCCSLLVQHFWSTPSRYRCFYTLLCKTSNRNYIIKIPPRLPSSYLTIEFERLFEIIPRVETLGRIEGRIALQARVSINNSFVFELIGVLTLFSGNKQNCFITRPFI